MSELMFIAYGLGIRLAPKKRRASQIPLLPQISQALKAQTSFIVLGKFPLIFASYLNCHAVTLRDTIAFTDELTPASRTNQCFVLTSFHRCALRIETIHDDRCNRVKSTKAPR